MEKFETKTDVVEAPLPAEKKIEQTQGAEALEKQAAKAPIMKETPATVVTKENPSAVEEQKKNIVTGIKEFFRKKTPFEKGHQSIYGTPKYVEKWNELKSAGKTEEAKEYFADYAPLLGNLKKQATYEEYLKTDPDRAEKFIIAESNSISSEWDPNTRTYRSVGITKNPLAGGGTGGQMSNGGMSK